MNLKVFLKLKNPKNSLFWSNIFFKNQRNPKTQKTQKNQKNPKTHWAGFFVKKKRVFSNPATTPG
jgi:hypothetical protein